MAAVKALPATALFRKCDAKLLSFRTTDELEDLDQVLGQTPVPRRQRCGPLERLLGLDEHPTPSVRLRLLAERLAHPRRVASWKMVGRSSAPDATSSRTRVRPSRTSAVAEETPSRAASASDTSSPSASTR